MLYNIHTQLHFIKDSQPDCGAVRVKVPEEIGFIINTCFPNARLKIFGVE